MGPWPHCADVTEISEKWRHLSEGRLGHSAPKYWGPGRASFFESWAQITPFGLLFFPLFLLWLHVLLLKLNCGKFLNIWYGIKERIALLMEEKQWEKKNVSFFLLLDWKYNKSLGLVWCTVIQHVFCCEMTSRGWGVRMEFQLIPWNYADYLRCQMYMCQGAFESLLLVRSFFKSGCLGPFS